MFLSIELIYYMLNINEYGNSLAVQWLGPHACIVAGVGSIPGWGTRIPQATMVRPKEKKKDD